MKKTQLLWLAGVFFASIASEGFVAHGHEMRVNALSGCSSNAPNDREKFNPEKDASGKNASGSDSSAEDGRCRVVAEQREETERKAMILLLFLQMLKISK